MNRQNRVKTEVRKAETLSPTRQASGRDRFGFSHEPANPNEPPTIEDIQNTERPILVEYRNSLSGKVAAHKPGTIKGELTTICDSKFIDQLRVEDHFLIRQCVAPCRDCFPDGFPFSYDITPLEPYLSMDMYGNVPAKPIVPTQMIPDNTVYLGDFDHE